MAPVDPRVDAIEKKLDQQSGLFAELSKDVAVLQAGVSRIERDIQSAQDDRRKLASEIGAFGIQLTKFVQTVANLESASNEIRSAVTLLIRQESERAGAVKAASATGKFIVGAWGVLSGMVGAAIALAAWLASGGRH